MFYLGCVDPWEEGLLELEDDRERGDNGDDILIKPIL